MFASLVDFAAGQRVLKGETPEISQRLPIIDVGQHPEVLKCFQEPVTAANVVPNYAGHYRIEQCPCGMDCFRLLIWNTASRKVLWDALLPSMSTLARNSGSDHRGPEFTRGSARLSIDACFVDDGTLTPTWCGVRIYELRKGSLILLGARPSRADEVLSVEDAEALVRATPDLLAASRSNRCPRVETLWRESGMAAFQARSTCNATGSGTIGNYTVDLRTAQVWIGLKEKPVDSPELRRLRSTLLRQIRERRKAK